MKFEILENGTLRCTLTQNDLEQNGIGLEDFFTNSKLARDFMEKLIHMAEEEVGFQTNGNMMSIQASVLPDNQIVLTFTEGTVNQSDILEHIKNLFHKEDGIPSTQKEDVFREMLEKSERMNTQEDSKEEMETEQSEEAEQGYCYLVTFDSFEKVKQFCHVLPINFAATSCLYCLEKKKQYYLWADLTECSRKYTYEFVAASMEYAKTIEKDSPKSNYLREHAKVILKEEALERLADL